MPFDPTIVDKGSYFYAVGEGETAPPVGDGKTYSRALGWQSPEGNFYGQERWVRDWPSSVVWNGNDYQILEPDGSATSFSALPKPGDINPNTGLPYAARPDFEIWSIPRINPVNTEGLTLYDTRNLDFCYWDTAKQKWILIEWFYSVDYEEDLPRPGLKRGAVHVINYRDIKVFWDGYVWRRYHHDMLDLGENDILHLPEGFLEQNAEDIQGLITNIEEIGESINVVKDDLVDAFKDADIPLDENWEQNVCIARVVYESPTSIGLEATVSGKVGGIWVNGELIVDDEIGSDAVTLLNTHPVLLWNAQSGALSAIALATNTEYTIYLANHASSAFNIGGRDARGKLFLSLTENTNGYLGASGPALNARAVGKVSTDSSSPPKFRREIDLSWVAKTTSFPETYREYCDYKLEYVDETSVRLSLLDTLYGQLTIAGQLMTFGTNNVATIEDPRVLFMEGQMLLDNSSIRANTLYHIYVSNSADQFNFNLINSATGRPWQESDEGAAGHYDSSLDLRKTIFFSEKTQEHGVLSETWPGYYARHVGQVYTDDNGFLKYSNSLSAIRSLTLNPTHLDGLAEISFKWESSSLIRIESKRGTTGIIYVNGEPIPVTTLNCDYLSSDSIVYTYTGSFTTPLSSDETITNYVGNYLYIYVTNSRDIFGSLSKSVICSSSEPVGGYMSSNWPGNNARWIGTLRQSPIACGDELVLNGDFDTDSVWNYDKGWLYDSVNHKMVHDSGVLPLYQDISLTEDQLYRLLFTISSRSEGTITPRVGGTAGTPISTVGNIDVDIEASNEDLVEFVPTQTFDGGIDSVSLKITSLNLVTNGTCDTDSNWTKGAGWSYDSSNHRYYHSVVNDWITQNISVTNNRSYYLTFTLSVSAGSIIPCLGGTNGSTYTTSGSKSATITSGSGGYIRFKASYDFSGTIDSVSVKDALQVVDGSFSNVVSAWTVEEDSGWEIGGGRAFHDNSSNYSGSFYQSLSLIQGHTYSVTYTVGYYTTGSCRVSLGGTEGSLRGANGTYTENIISGSSGTISFYASGSFSGTIDDVSITDTTEYVSNGDFSSSSGWTCEIGWSIGSGVATHANDPDYLTQSLTLSSGATYRLLFTTTGRSTGSLTPVLSGTSGSAITTNTQHEIELVAGSSNYIRFVATDDYDGSIDDIIIKITGAELVTNGNFDTDTSWDKGIGWVWDGVGYKLDYYPEYSMILSQELETSSNRCYELTYSLGSYVSGTLIPKLGGVSSLPDSGAGNKTHYIMAGSSGLLEFIPSPNFEGRIDNVSLKSTYGVFDNSFLSESVCGISTSVNDMVVSYSETWSSARIQAEIQKALGLISVSRAFDTQKEVGISVRLDWVSSNKIRLIPIVSNTQVLFSDVDGDSIIIPSGGIEYNITDYSGTVNVGSLYYVYLTSSSELVLSTHAPVTSYSKLEIYNEMILVGYISVASSDTMAGTWNVYSYYNQPDQTWTKNITGYSSTYFDSRRGVVIPPGAYAIISRTGATNIAARTRQPSTPYTLYVDDTASLGTGTYSGSWKSLLAVIDITNPVDTELAYCAKLDMSVSLTATSLSPGIYNMENYGLVTSITSSGKAGYTYPGFTSCNNLVDIPYIRTVETIYNGVTGQLVFTRKGNM